MPNIFDIAMAAAWKPSIAVMGEDATFAGAIVKITVQQFEIGAQVNSLLPGTGRQRTGGAEITMHLADWQKGGGRKGSYVTVRGIDMRVVNIPTPSGSLVSLQLAPA